uniref:fruit protein pKIWI501-like n=1 Tax=Erigeron canadensis TaxID=72917 RepID=UPI001CB95F06|nr:fruit protein pKIWI501-like [Erigeron canadensis]
MASVEVKSAANTLPENLERTSEASKEAEPVVAAPLTVEPVVEEVKEETTIDGPPPAEEPPTTEVAVEADTIVVEETKSEVEEPKAETAQEKVKAAEEETLATTEAVPEEPQVTKKAGSKDNPATEEVKESVKEEEEPAEIAASTEVTTEK